MKLFTHFRRLIIALFAVIYLINYFLNIPQLNYFGSILIIIIVVQALPNLPKTNLRVCLGLFLIGGLLLVIKGASPALWLAALVKNAGLVTLFVAVPLIGIPLYYDNYEKELKNLALRHLTGVWGFCLLIAVITHLLGVIISIGAVPLIYELFKNNARLYKAEKLFVIALLQGYMTTGFWSPAWASIAVVTHNLAIPWLQIIPWGLLFALLGTGLSLLLIFLEIRRHPGSYQNLIPDPNVKVSWSRIITLVLLIGGFIGAIIVVDIATTWELLVIIPLVSILFPLLAAVILNKGSQLQKGWQNYYANSLLKVKNEVILFTAAGFLGKALEVSGISQIIPQLLPPWLHNYHLVTILFLMSIMILVSLPGIHPIVSGSALVGALDPLTLGLTPFIFGLTILTGWAISILLSPFSAVSLITAGLEGLPSWHISLKFNGPFGIALLLIMTVVLATLAQFM